MLLQFTVENFLSIKQKITLSMLASKDNSLDQNLIRSKDGNNFFLKSIAIYGANAAGKSNVVKALAFMKHFVLTCTNLQSGDKIDVVPFKLDEESANRPSGFEIVFTKNDLRYTYGFKLDSRKVHEEYLYYYPRGRRSIIFERKETNKYKFTRDNDEQLTLSNRTLDNRLYLSASAEWNYKETTKVFEWFKDDLVVGHYSDISNDAIGKGYTAQLLMDRPDMRSEIEKFITIADVGVAGLTAEFIDVSNDKLTSDMPELLKRILTESRAKRIDVQTAHKINDKYNKSHVIFFRLEEESMGTIKLFDIAGRWLDVLNYGRVLVLDEFDRSLHPNILDALLSQFHDTRTNRNGAQLVFTTHNTHILTLDNFRRDQIWFTEKDPESGATDFYSLYEISGVRKDENVAKGYLSGRYGAVPFIGGLL